MIAGNIPGQTQTMSVAIYDAVQAGRNGPALAMVVIISAITLGILFLTNRLQGEHSH
jgi:molybdate transport system permease protein